MDSVGNYRAGGARQLELQDVLPHLNPLPSGLIRDVTESHGPILAVGDPWNRKKAHDVPRQTPFFRVFSSESTRMTVCSASGRSSTYFGGNRQVDGSVSYTEEELTRYMAAPFLESTLQ